jgi:hypothetical protein
MVIVALTVEIISSLEVMMVSNDFSNFECKGVIDCDRSCDIDKDDGGDNDDNNDDDVDDVDVDVDVDDGVDIFTIVDFVVNTSSFLSMHPNIFIKIDTFSLYNTTQ